MAICIGCGRDVPGLEKGEFCRMCGGGDDWDYEEAEEIDAGDEEDA